MTRHTRENEVAFFTCGGTIDKKYFDAKSDYKIGSAALPAILRRARVELPPPLLKPVSLLKKDSLDMTEADRRKVAAAVAACRQKRIVISHGTDTAADTARAIERGGGKGKTVVLVGAFLPAAFRDSDADFNIGFALAAALCMPPGVYVAMNGRIFPAATVRKNRAAGRFEG